MSTVIRSLMVKIGADLTDAQKGLNQMSKNLKNAGKEMTAAGTALTKGFTVPIVGAVAGLTALTVKAAGTADDLNTLSAKTGISTKALQEMSYATKFVDVDLDTMTDSMYKLTKNMGEARDGTKDQVEAFEALGISATDSNGQLRDSQTVWYEVIDALGNVANEAERDVIAYKLFGRSAQELNPLIVAGSDKLADLADEANNVGAVLDQNTLNSLNGLNDTIDRLKNIAESAGNRIGAAFAPVLEKLTPIIEEKIVPAVIGFADKISALIDWFSNLDPKMQKFILGLTGVLVAAGPVLTIVGGITTNIGGLIKGVSSAIGAVKGIAGAFSFMLSPAGLVIAAVAGIALAAYAIYKNWDGIKAFFTDLWNGVVDVFKKAVNGIIKVVNLIPGIEIPLLDTSTATAANTKTSGKIYGSSGGHMAEYALGTNYVPMTGMALLHQGEAVIPADQNNGYTGGGVMINITGNTISSDYDVDRIGNLLVKKLKLAGVIA